MNYVNYDSQIVFLSQAACFIKILKLITAWLHIVCDYGYIPFSFMMFYIYAPLYPFPKPY